MRKIEVTVEVRRRYCKEVELQDEAYEAFINGEIDELQIDEIDFYRLFDECRNGDAYEDSDYSICDENGDTVVPWND